MTNALVTCRIADVVRALTPPGAREEVETIRSGFEPLGDAMTEKSREPDQATPASPDDAVLQGGGAAERLREFRRARGDEPVDPTTEDPPAGEPTGEPGRQDDGD